MSTNEGTVTCSVNLVWSDTQGTTLRKTTHKTATVRLLRNSDNRDIIVEITALKAHPIKLQLHGVTVHKKFMNEGKASINFATIRCIMYLANAPPAQLFDFLRTIYFKLNGGSKDSAAAAQLNKSLRTQLLTNTSNRPKQLDEISPVTFGEVDVARAKLSKSTTTTPSPKGKKRKLSTADSAGDCKVPLAKKLYASSPVPKEPLDLEQQDVMDACLSGRNVFFTGSAGTGKSYLLKRIIRALPPDSTTATASTGVAACQIGGITLHQFAGIGGGDATLERSFQMASKPTTASIWRKCKHLIIDEISMIDGDYFEKIEQVARHVRRNNKPFGGIQLILCGDFFQLPPISKQYNNDGGKTTRFCFQSKAWEQCVQIVYELKRVHRQNDNQFIDMLNSIRLGRVSETTVKRLMETSKQKIENQGILATRLCSHTQDANIINESKLNALDGDKVNFIAEDTDGLTKQLDQQTPVSSSLELKIGAQVMLLKNINVATGLVNGARGVVKAFKQGLPLVRFRTEEYLVKQERWIVKTAGGGTLYRKQVPLRLAWAFSIHKSQGLTLDCVEMALGRVFEAGQAYVALSRAQSLDTLRVLDFKASQVWANPDVLTFYQSIDYRMDCTKLIPLGKKSANNNNKVNKGVKRMISGRQCSNKPLVTIS